MFVSTSLWSLPTVLTSGLSCPVTTGLLLEVLMNLLCSSCSGIVVFAGSQLYFPYGAISPCCFLIVVVVRWKKTQPVRKEMSDKWQKYVEINILALQSTKKTYSLMEGVRYSGEVIAPIPGLKRKNDNEKIKELFWPNLSVDIEVVVLIIIQSSVKNLWWFYVNVVIASLQS